MRGMQEFHHEGVKTEFLFRVRLINAFYKLGEVVYPREVDNLINYNLLIEELESVANAVEMLDSSARGFRISSNEQAVQRDLELRSIGIKTPNEIGIETGIFFLILEIPFEANPLCSVSTRLAVCEKITEEGGINYLSVPLLTLNKKGRVFVPEGVIIKKGTVNPYSRVLLPLISQPQKS